MNGCTDSLSSVNIEKKLVIIGGGPAGHAAATSAARLGAEVVLIERDIIGGAAHLLDCVPSKTMISTGAAMKFTDNLSGMGLESRNANVDVEALTARIEGIKTKLSNDVTSMLENQGVLILRGTASLVDQ
ncbi:MAG: hypothetical protein RJA15_916, partial [Actinomycetota bacterium]